MTRSLRYNGGTVDAITGEIGLLSPVGGTRKPTAGIQVHEHDGAGRLTKLSFGAEAGTSYGYDDKDRITNMNVFGVGRKFTYDDDDQLTLASGSGASGGYSYDGNFNRTSNGSSIGAGNRLKSDGQWSYRYDANGNLIGKANYAGAAPAAAGDVSVAYSYDHRNRLTGVTTSTFNNVGSSWILYRYDNEDRLVSRSGSVQPEFYGYDGRNRIVVIHPGSENVVVRRYLTGLNEDEVFEMDVEVAMGAYPGATPLYRFWLMGDHQGSIRRALKDSGTIARRIDYDEFGNITNDKGIGPSPDVKYTGQFYEKTTKLHNHGARWYAADVARFINQDPARDGTNWFAYVGNNPVSLWDPTGLAAFGGSGFSASSAMTGIFGTNGIVGGSAPTPAWTEMPLRPWVSRTDWTAPPTIDTSGLFSSGTLLPWQSRYEFGANGTTFHNSYATRGGYTVPRQAVPTSSLSNGNPNALADAGENFRQSANQLIKGNYTNDVTLLGTSAQVVTGFTGVDLPGDIRDIVYDVTHWKWDRWHAGQTALDIAGILPVVGVLKYGDEVGTLIKGGHKPVKAAQPQLLQITRLSRPNRLVFDGMEVRAVRDLSHVKESTLRQMSKDGFAATDIHGRKLHLHHLAQNPAGPIVEIPKPLHDVHNPVQHPRSNSPGVGLTAQERAAFDTWRENYWKARAAEELNRRGPVP